MINNYQVHKYIIDHNHKQKDKNLNNKLIKYFIKLAFVFLLWIFNFLQKESNY